MTQIPLLEAPAASAQTSTEAGSLPLGSILALGFGTTVAMWAVAYVCRLPQVQAPGLLLGLAFIGCYLGGGFVTGRTLPGHAALNGARVGGLASLLNLLILGSVLVEHGGRQGLIGGLGTLAVGALLAAVGALAGHRVNAQPAPRNWDGWLARVAAVATLLLLGAGGLVTSHEAGLAVPDWPNSFSSNMFLYPLSRMTGGIYLEHAHRLFGSLVGLTTAVLTLHLWRVEQRAWVRRLAFAAFALVCLQGLLGGLRVTGGLTLTTDRSVLAPSTTLALVHGVTGQLFFSVLCLLAAAVSTQWRRDDLSDGIDREAARATGTLTGWLVGILVVQLVLGAAVRHFTWGIALHVTGGLTVLLLGILVGVRAWGLHVDRPVLPQLGVALAVLVSLQFLLGMGSYAVTAAEESGGMLAAYQVPVTTIHQTCGAAVLGAAVLLHAWARRALPAEPAAATAAPAVG